MDPISQGAVGAVAARCLGRKVPDDARLAIGVGWIGGMLADADVFIRSSEDSLLQLEFHRHFSHSLIFVPVGGLIGALLLWLLLRKGAEFPKLFLYATAGFATAGLLDACTSYGTQLFWPFSDARVAWHIISIIDPAFTLTILVLLGVAWKTRKRKWAGIAAVFILGYLAVGRIEQNRTAKVQQAMIMSRGHESATQATVKSTIGNRILWRSVYQFKGKYYVDGIRHQFFGGSRVIDGTSVTALSLDDLKAGIPDDSILAEDLDRFDHFSASYLARHPDDPEVVGDLRYSVLPTSAKPLWGIRYDPGEFDQHVEFESFRDSAKEDRATFFRLLMGR